MLFLLHLVIPGNYEKNKLLKNLKKANKQKNIEIFHAGTKLDKNKFYSNGGRVLSVTANQNIRKCKKFSYKTIKKYKLEIRFFRKRYWNKKQIII